MVPDTFPEKTKTLARPQGTTEDECGPLDVYNNGEISISKWKMSWRERLHCLFRGYVWAFVWFGPTQPPICIEGKKTVFEHAENKG